MDTDPLEQDFALARAHSPNAPDGDERWREVSLAHSERRRLLAVVDVAVPGGHVVTLAPAAVSAWLPDSQRAPPGGGCEPGALIEVLVLALRRESGEVIVPQRALVEADIARARALEWDRLAVGQQRAGRVVAILPFGAFVDVGAGVQAMLHEPGAVLEEGQLVNVEVIRMDPGTRRLMVKRIP